MKLLQIRDNGGQCPFSWQEFRVFEKGYMAGSCQRPKLFGLNDLTTNSRLGERVNPAVLLGDLCQSVAKGVNDEFEAVGDLQF